MTKKPRASLIPDPRKVPRVGIDPIQWQAMSPAWRVARMEVRNRFGWHLADGPTLLAIREKLAQFETMTWRDIIQRCNGHHHYISDLDKILAPARERLNAIGYRDTDQLFSLRLTGRQRVWGILDLGVFTVLWWDPEHEIYPTPLKGT